VYVWAYGVEGEKDTFAHVGLVGFDKDKKVSGVASPIFPQVLRKGADKVLLSKNPTRTRSGVYCYLGPIEYAQDNRMKVNVSLINEGTVVFSLKHDNTGIVGGGVLELYDRKMYLMLRQDMIAFHSPVSPKVEDWPVMTIEPGERKTEEMWIEASMWEEYGDFLPGMYYVRFLFPLEKGKLFSSNIVKFSYKTYGLDILN
jgi:hypothetical protein